MTLSALALASAWTLVAVWIGYPVVVALIAMLRRTTVPTPTSERPRVAVVLATREDAHAVKARVRDILATDYDASRLEVVVAVDASAEMGDPADYGATDARVRVVRGGPVGGKAVNLNAGVEAATGDVLVFTDTYQRFAPTAIDALVGALRGRWAAASGRLELPAQGMEALPVRLYWRMEVWLRRNEARLHSTIGATGAIWAMRRDRWKPLPAGLILDDLYTPMRLVLEGDRVAFVDEARAREERPLIPAREFRRKARTQTGVLQLCAWLPGVLVPIRNPVWLQFALHKLVRLLTPYLALVCVAVYGTRLAAAAAHHPSWIVALALTVVVASVATRGRALAIAFHAAQTWILVQAAVVAAMWNGLRGRWDVW
jgi:cellulose synthase/poly-beta-1,6-N-acetylglucosamine synthase-like glycosyltransferase